MCCLFGLLDCGSDFSPKQKSKMLSILGAECEIRGTDATGIAYNSAGELHIYKRPVPAHKLRMRLPADARIIMGHTRMTTQGSEKRNYNNHPFLGQAGVRFALAHNGVLRNDKALRKSESLPKTKIETDSYIAVQLMEQKKPLNFSSLKSMAEKVEGSFTFTLLDERNNWYLVKGDNPMCLYWFPQSMVYLYASTESILSSALCRIPLKLGKSKKIVVADGEILRINARGQIARSRFEMKESWWSYPVAYSYESLYCSTRVNQSYTDELKSVAAAFGYSPRFVDSALGSGFTLDEVAEMLYCNEL